MPCFKLLEECSNGEVRFLKTFKYNNIILFGMKILVTGGSGLLGSAVSHYFREYFDVAATYTTHKVMVNGCEMVQLDITNVKNTINTVKKIKPDVIIHTAALVGVSACEKDPALSHKTNVEGTKNLAESAKITNSRIIYISTDYVFDGKRGMYSENDIPTPINDYGKTKLEGEKLIDIENNLIVRTSIYGWNIVEGKKSFSTWLIDELSNNKRVNLFSDQFNSMMLANNCAEALKEIVDKGIKGILNIASSEKVSKYDFAFKLAEIFGLDKNLINNVKNSEVAGYEKRPLDVSLDVSKAKKELKTKLLDARDGLLKMKELKNNGYLSNFKEM